MKTKSCISSFFSFMTDVRKEIDKISWPGRKEVVMMTIVVFVLAIVASVFFSVIDTIAYKIMHFIIDR